MHRHPVDVHREVPFGVPPPMGPGNSLFAIPDARAILMYLT